MRTLLITILTYHVLFFSVQPISAQDPDDDKLAEDLFKTGDSLFRAGNYNESKDYLIESADYFEKLERWEKAAEVLNMLCEANWQSAQMEEAISVANRILNICEDYLTEDHIEAATAYNNIGVVHAIQGDMKTAEKQFLRALEVRLNWYDSANMDLANSFNNLGNIYLHTGDYDLSLDYHNKALAMRIELVGETHPDVADSYNNIGTMYAYMSQSELALEYALKAFELRLELLGENHPVTISTYGNVGNGYYGLRNYERAEEYTIKAVTIGTEVLGENHPVIANAYDGLGLLNLERGDYEKSIEYYDKANKILTTVLGEVNPYSAVVNGNLCTAYTRLGLLEEAERKIDDAIRVLNIIYPDGNENVAECNVKLGDIYISKNDYNTGIEYHKKALNLRQELMGKNHEIIAKTNNLIARDFLDWDQPQAALKYFQNSIVVNSISFKDTTVTSNPIIGDFQNAYALLESLNGKGKAFFKIDPDKYAINILNSYLSCDTLITLIQRSHQRYEDKKRLAELTSDVYEAAVNISNQLYISSGDPKYKDLIFFFSERNKSSILNQSISENLARKYAGISEELLQLELITKSNKSYYQSQVYEMESMGNYDTLKYNRFRNQLFETNTVLDSLISVLENDYPQYYQLKYDRRISTLDDVQDNLDENEILIEFMEGESLIYALGVTNDNFSIEVVNLDSALLNSLQNFRNSLDINSVLNFSAETVNDFETSANDLFDILLKPTLNNIGRGKNRIVIIPDGRLSYFPWAILVTESKGSNDFETLDYLLNDYSVSYGYSASLLTGNRSSASNGSSVLAMAASYESLDTGKIADIEDIFRNELVPLKWNSEEVAQINTYFDGSFFTGNEATEINFKETVSDHNIIHLAMHALVDNQRPMQSKLVFTQLEDSTEDNQLHIHELFNMDIKSDLVVLSACNTGIGKLEKGEGVMSLGRAFAYAGCPSIVMSHWSVDDRSTSDLMGLFYKYLADNYSKDEALRLAKLEFLESSTGPKSHPYYWGGFVVLGNTSPLSKDISWLWYMASLIIVIILTIYILRFFRTTGH